MIWLSTLWLKVRFYVFAALGVAGAILAGAGYGWLKAKEHAAGKVQKAKQQATDAKATTKAYRKRAEVEDEVEKMADAGHPQKIADADTDTAAGKLRDRWTR